MPEGLSPIEAGKKLHEHATEPHQPATSEGGSRHSRMVQIGEAVLLSLVTIAAAWSGYAAAKWGTESRLELAQAATLRNLATRADLEALSTRNFDSSTFTAWFTAFTLDDPQKQAVAERRFRPEFKVAFDAWMATDPFNNPRAPPGPTYMPQYRLADQAKAEALDREPWPPRPRATTPGRWATTTSGSRCSWLRCCSWSGSVAPSSCIPSAMCCSASARCCSSWPPP
jgi:hypothetical protein